MSEEIKQKAREELDKLLTKIACDFVNYHSDTAMVFKDLEEKLPIFIDSLLSQALQKRDEETRVIIEEHLPNILHEYCRWVITSKNDDEQGALKRLAKKKTLTQELLSTLTTK